MATTIHIVHRSAGGVCAADGVAAGEAPQTFLLPGPAQQGKLLKNYWLKSNDLSHHNLLNSILEALETC